MTGTQIINIHVFNTPLTLILSFFLLNWVHYQFYKNVPYHTSPERGQRLGSSGDDKDDDKDTHKDKYKDEDKDRTFKKKVFLYIQVKVLCPAINIYRRTVAWHHI